MMFSNFNADRTRLLCQLKTKVNFVESKTFQSISILVHVTRWLSFSHFCWFWLHTTAWPVIRVQFIDLHIFHSVRRNYTCDELMSTEDSHTIQSTWQMNDCCWTWTANGQIGNASEFYQIENRFKESRKQGKPIKENAMLRSNWGCLIKEKAMKAENTAATCHVAISDVYTL